MNSEKLPLIDRENTESKESLDAKHNVTYKIIRVTNKSMKQDEIEKNHKLLISFSNNNSIDRNKDREVTQKKHTVNEKWLPYSKPILPNINHKIKEIKPPKKLKYYTNRSAVFTVNKKQNFSKSRNQNPDKISRKEVYILQKRANEKKESLIKQTNEVKQKVKQIIRIQKVLYNTTTKTEYEIIEKKLNKLLQNGNDSDRVRFAAQYQLESVYLFQKNDFIIIMV